MTQEALSQLSPRDRTIRAARICGWKIRDSASWSERLVTDPGGKSWCPSDPRTPIEHLLPDADHDLNAIALSMRLIEGNPLLRSEYEGHLRRLCGDALDLFALVNAPPDKRVDALLLTVDPPSEPDTFPEPADEENTKESSVGERVVPSFSDGPAFWDQF